MGSAYFLVGVHTLCGNAEKEWVMKWHSHDSGTYCNEEIFLGMQKEDCNRPLRRQADREGCKRKSNGG